VDRESLQAFLERGLSLAEIGRRFERHESTVAYWVRKHGLEAGGRERYASRGGVPREQLHQLVLSGASIAEIAEQLGLSKGTIRHWLGRYGLKTRGGVGRRSSDLTRAARESGALEVLTECPSHGVVSHVRDARGYFRCRICRQEAVVRRRRRVKAILVEEAGGRCRICGYDRYDGALVFHHVSPETKAFGVAEGGMARSLARLRAEVRKCVLLCSNCHAEVENGRTSLSGIAQLDGPG
jgi:transposase-like protein